MGGSGTLLMPVTPTSMSSWASHQLRSPKSSEPGTDMFVPIGTPVYAPEAGIIYGSGNTIGPATGRWVGIHFQSGMAWRVLHLSRLVRTSGVVHRGDLLGYSGASGYGYEDWSHLSNMPAAHVHVTLWPTIVKRFGYDSQGRPYTIDFMNFVGGPAGGGTTPEDDMPLNVDDKAWLRLMIQQEVAGISNTVDGMDARLKLVEGAVARFPGNGTVVPRTDDVAAWVALARDDIAAVDAKVTALGA